MPKKRPEPTTPAEAIGMELASLRTKRRVSQDEMAEVLGVSRSGYNLWERGVNGMPLPLFLRAVDHLGADPIRVFADARKDYASAFNLIEVTWGEDFTLRG